MCWHNCLAPSCIPIISTETGWGGPGPCLAFATHSALISSSQQWACYHQPHKGVFSMAPGCSISLLLLVKTVGEGCCVAACPWAGGMRGDSKDYKSRCSPPGCRLMGSRICSQEESSVALPVITNTGAVAEQFPSVCEFSFRILPETVSILWVPTGTPRASCPGERERGHQAEYPVVTLLGLQGQDCQDGSSLNQKK